MSRETVRSQMLPGPLLMPPWRRKRTDGGKGDRLKAEGAECREERGLHEGSGCGNGEDTRVDMFIY